MSRLNHESIYGRTAESKPTENLNQQIGSKVLEFADRKHEIESEDAARQQRKIIASLALTSGDKVDLSPFKEHDVEIDDEARDFVLEGFYFDLYEDEERQILDAIRGPVQLLGAESVFSDINAKHELRILGYMVDGELGFNTFYDLTPDTVQDFLTRFPSPMDFDAKSADFLDTIEYGNGPRKREEYESAMASFRHKIYGKKQEYWDQMRALSAEARVWHDMKRAAEAAREVSSTSPEAHEWIDVDVGVWQISRQQSAREFDRHEQADDSCQDCYLRRDDQKLYAVFDGAGGHGGGREASYTASQSVSETADNYILNSGADLAFMLNTAGVAVEDNPDAGYSTAVLVKEVNRDGRRMLAWASIGDSRLYVVHEDRSTEQITRDEGEGNVITNALGHPAREGESLTRQWGEVEIHDGDSFVLCSDGITGDRPEEAMSPERIGDIVSDAADSQDAAIRLMFEAQKMDDRTVVVLKY